MIIGPAAAFAGQRPVAASGKPWLERLKAAPYGEERDRACVEVLDQLGKKPELEGIARAARAWGVAEDSFALEQLLAQLDQGERDLRKLAYTCTPITASDQTLARQLDSFGDHPGCKLARELWDATDWKSIRHAVRDEALTEQEHTPLGFAWSVKSTCARANPPDKEKLAEVFFRAVESHPRERWVTEKLDAWGVPRTWATLEKACESWASSKGPRDLALLVTDSKDFATQRRQLDGLGLALHEAVAEPKKQYVWQEAMRRPEGLLKNYLGYHYSASKEEDAAVYEVVWPTLRRCPSGQLAERWGLKSIEALKWISQHPEYKDPWQVALTITRSEDGAAMRIQLAEQDTPAGKLANRLASHLEDGQLKELWQKALRGRELSEAEAPQQMLWALNLTVLDEEPSLPLVQAMWRDCERTSEQLEVVSSLARLARGEGLGFVVDKLRARSILSDGLRQDLTRLRTEGPTWEKLQPLLDRLKKEALQEDAVRRLNGEKRDPTSGIKERPDAVEVGGVRLPRRRTG